MQSWRSTSVIVPTVLVTLPCWVSPLLAGRLLHDVTVFIMLGTFLGPLTMPSSLAPSVSDAQEFHRFILQWLLEKIDVTLKTTLALFVGTMIGLIPVVGDFAATLARSFFPVIEHKQASVLFDSVLSGGAAVAVMMYAIRLSQVLLYGVWPSVLFAFSLGFGWVQLQWFTNEVFVPQGSLVLILGKSIAYTLLLGFLIDYIRTRASYFTSKA